MIKPRRLETICKEKDFEHKPNWPRMVERLKTILGNNPRKSFSLEKYMKFLSEIYLDLQVEDKAEEYPEFNICLEPFKERKLNRKFRYTKTGKLVSYVESPFYRLCWGSAGRIFAEAKEDYLAKLGENVSKGFEYDKVITIGKVRRPIVFEIELGELESRKRRLGEGYRLVDKLREYEQRLFPICSFFKSCPGHVVVVQKSVYYNRAYRTGEDSIFHRFIKNGGIIRPFYKDIEDFREEVRHVISEYRLPLRKIKCGE